MITFGRKAERLREWSYELTFTNIMRLLGAAAALLALVFVAIASLSEWNISL
jgi:hypothetical protein